MILTGSTAISQTGNFFLIGENRKPPRIHIVQEYVIGQKQFTGEGEEAFFTLSTQYFQRVKNTEIRQFLFTK